MLCNLCKKRVAVVFFEQITNNGKRKVCLCEKCATARGIVGVSQVPDARKIVDLIAELDANSEKSQGDAKRICPVCKRSLFEIKKTHRVGCSYCYTAFAKEIAKLASKIFVLTDEQKVAIAKKSSSPTVGGTVGRTIRSIKTLEKKLAIAVDEENYELAAELRDKIKALNTNIAQ